MRYVKPSLRPLTPREKLPKGAGGARWPQQECCACLPHTMPAPRAKNHAKCSPWTPPLPPTAAAQEKWNLLPPQPFLSSAKFTSGPRTGNGTRTGLEMRIPSLCGLFQTTTLGEGSPSCFSVPTLAKCSLSKQGHPPHTHIPPAAPAKCCETGVQACRGTQMLLTFMPV